MSHLNTWNTNIQIRIAPEWLYPIRTSKDVCVLQVFSGKVRAGYLQFQVTNINIGKPEYHMLTMFYDVYPITEESVCQHYRIKIIVLSYYHVSTRLSNCIVWFNMVWYALPFFINFFGILSYFMVCVWPTMQIVKQKQYFKILWFYKTAILEEHANIVHIVFPASQHDHLGGAKPWHDHVVIYIFVVSNIYGINLDMLW